MHKMIKRYFPHPHYAVYRCAGRARRAVNCVIAAVTWSDRWTNHHRSAVSIPHFTFCIPHSAIPHFTHSQLHNVCITDQESVSEFKGDLVSDQFTRMEAFRTVTSATVVIIQSIYYLFNTIQYI